MALESVVDLAVHVILSKLGPTDAASVASVSRRFRSWASEDDSIWEKFCSDELALKSPVDPLGRPTGSFKEAYRSWRDAFLMYPWSLVIRVKSCWDRLKNWLAANFPEVLDTLRSGASEDQIKTLELTLQVNLPLPTRVLYRLCDGQELMDHESSGSEGKCLLGLIGGYSFYNHLVNVFLLPLHRIIEITRIIQRSTGFNFRSNYIAIAVCSIFSGKIFFLYCTKGQLHVGTSNLRSDGEMIPCVPDSLLNSVRDSKGSQIQDAMLLWLEEHGRRLENGIVRVRKEGDRKWINLFPEQPPLCSTAVTNSVKVRASSVFVPEQSNLQDEEDRFLFAYSIRMSLLSEGCIINGMKFGSCQLYWRNWVISANDIIVDSVNGEVVIGKNCRS